MNNNDFLGIDLKLNDDFDIEFSADGDLFTVSGAECVAQDIKIAINESNIYNILNNENIDINDVKEFIEDIILDEPRVIKESIQINVKKILNGLQIDFEVIISFNLIGENNRQNLVFNLNEYIDMEKL